MATSKPEITEYIHSCPICLEAIKTPKSLPCFHTFCKNCIGEFIVATAQKQKAKISSYPCPVCKTSTTPSNQEEDVSKWASLLPDNLLLAPRRNIDKENTEFQCDLCKRRQKSTKGSFWCMDCNEVLCDYCNEVHSVSKASSNHRVSRLDNVDANKYGIDVTIISTTCPFHNPKTLEAYCFDHKQLCCLFCVTQTHRKCENVKAIEDTEFTDKKSSADLGEVLTTLQQIIEHLILQRNKKLELLDESAKTSQAEASKVVACAKDKLDCLLIAFTKELTILQDSEKFAIDEELGRLNQLLQDTYHLVGVFQVVNDEGNHIRKFIQAEKTKTRIQNDIFPGLNDIFVENEKVLLELQINSILKNVDSMSNIGKVEVVKSSDKDSEEMITAKKNIGILVEGLELKVSLKVNITTALQRVITFRYMSFSCGLSISEHVVACGNQHNGEMLAIDILSESSKYYTNYYFRKRLAIDKKTGNIFVTLQNGYFENITSQFTQINYFQDKLIGGIAILEDDVHVIVENEIRKFKTSAVIHSTSQMTFCFNVNTECSNEELNGLAIDSKRKHIIYTSKDNKVICTNLQGDEIFQFEERKVMKKPISVRVHSSGYIIVGDESGSVHAISPDGTKHFMIIEKCQRISKLCDIWLDQSEQTLFLCGNEFIEIYHIDVLNT